MNRIILILILVGLTSFLFAQGNIEVPQSQNSVVTKKTAQWCPPCGSWAWSFYEDLLSANPDNTLLLSAQIEGGSSDADTKIETLTSAAITENFGDGNARPRFYLNNDNQGVLSFNRSEKQTEILEKIALYAEQLPIAQAGIRAEYSDTNLVVSTNTKFFQATEGRFYLGVYTVEKLVTADQAGRSGDSEHKNVLKNEFTGQPFGTELAMGDVAINTEYPLRVQLPLADIPALNNLIVATIIWKEEGEQKEILNTNFTETFTEQQEAPDTTTTTATVFTRAEVKNFTVYPSNIVLGQRVPVNINLRLAEPSRPIALAIYNLAGQKVADVFQGHLGTEQGIFNWQPSPNLTEGLYIVKLSVGHEVHAKKIILND